MLSSELMTGEAFLQSNVKKGGERMTTLDFFAKKLGIDVSKKLIFFDEKDKKAVNTDKEVIRFNNGTFTVEKRALFALEK